MASDQTDAVSRRRVLQSGAVLAGLGVAGCSGVLDDGGETPATDSGTRTSTPTESETAEPTATATAEPDRPSIERQVILRDKAAITHVRRTVTGDIVWPSFASYDTVDPALLGVWSSGNYALGFTQEKRFVNQQDGSRYEGTYMAVDGLLVLQYETGEEFQYLYSVTERDGQVVLTLENQDGETATLARSEARSDDRDLVTAFEDVILVEEENSTTEGGEIRTGGTGSGFIVTPDGYVVTNAHVVGTHEDARETLYNRLAVRTQEEVRRSLDEDYDLSESERREIESVLLNKLFSYYAEKSSVSGTDTAIDVMHGSAGPNEEVAVRSWSATVETAGTVTEEVGGEPSWGRDVAILSVDADATLPTVPVGDSTAIGTGEKTFVVGYPGIGVEEYFQDRNTALEPTLTSGVVSARRTLNSGVEAIQTDAGINNGNSGGPMYNAEGEVVGIATFKPTSLDVEEVAFGLPVETATGFLSELGVTPESGELDAAYGDALNAYWRDDCEAVEERVEDVLDLWPEHPYVGELTEDC